MKNNNKPLLLLFFLLSIVLFLAGFRYGRKVEQMDKSYIPPTPIIIPTKSSVTPTIALIKFKTHNSLICQLSFLIPDNFVAKKKDGFEILSNQNETVIIDCNQKNVRKNLIDFEDATPSAQYKLNSQKINVFETSKNRRLWTIKNPYNQELVLIETDSNLVPIIIKTLEFNQPMEITPTI